MAVTLQVHPQNPQPRLLAQAVAQLRNNGLLVYPTDTCYALGCRIEAKSAQDRLRRMRQLDVYHDLSLLFASISQLSDYAKLDDRNFALLRRSLPGPFTFILPATHDLPRRLAEPRKRSVGVRVPQSPVVQALLAELGEPLMSSTLQLPGDPKPLQDPEEIIEAVGKQVDLLLLAGPGQDRCSTVIDLTAWPPRMQRLGLGDPALLGLDWQQDDSEARVGV